MNEKPAAYFFILYLDDRSIGAPIEGGGVFRGGTAGLLNGPGGCRFKDDTC